MSVDESRLATDAAYREDMRHRCMTDHYFLAEMMGFEDFVPRIHDAVFKDLYFPKNPLVAIAEQHPIKRRIHLDPRHTFKTTAGRVDSMQWILAFPQDITMLNITATQELAKAISKGLADYLSQVGIVTPLQKLFPELVSSKWAYANNETKWNTPVHNRKELDATLAYTSPGSTQSGWHPWVMNPDDMGETLNSGIGASDDSRKKVISTYKTNRNLLRPGGYENVRGTRYHPFEVYGDMLKRVDLKDPEASGFKLLIRSVMTRKDGSRLVPGEFPREDEVVMHFPELPNCTYQKSKDLFYDGYEEFMCQQMNDPQGGAVPTFDENLYQSCMVAPERVPQYRGELFICWRPMYAGKNSMKKCAGVAARVCDEKVYIVDCWEGNWIPSSFAERIVQHHRELQADGTMIMGVPGTADLYTHVRNEAARKNVDMRPQWTGWEENDHERMGTCKALEPLMKVGRLLFSQELTRAEECRKQFVHFGLIEETGLIECVAQLARQVSWSQMRARMQEDELEAQRRTREDAQVNSFFRQQGMPQVNEELTQKTNAHLKAMQKATNRGFNMPKLPGGLDG